jgi:hypothetical protein
LLRHGKVTKKLINWKRNHQFAHIKSQASLEKKSKRRREAAWKEKVYVELEKNALVYSLEVLPKVSEYSVERPMASTDFTRDSISILIWAKTVCLHCGLCVRRGDISWRGSRPRLIEVKV